MRNVRRRDIRRAILVCCAFGLNACAGRALPLPSGLTVESASFQSNAAMPTRSTCNGANVSPPLSWGLPPAGTQSFAIVVTDRDSPLAAVFGPFVHWIAYDVPPSLRRLREGIGTASTLADGTRQGTNGFGKIGFSGPCPPGGATHRYAFTVYALDRKLGLEPGAKLNELDAAMTGHVIAGGTLVAHYP